MDHVFCELVEWRFFAFGGIESLQPSISLRNTFLKVFSFDRLLEISTILCAFDSSSSSSVEIWPMKRAKTIDGGKPFLSRTFQGILRQHVHEVLQAFPTYQIALCAGKFWSGQFASLHP